MNARVDVSDDLLELEVRDIWRRLLLRDDVGLDESFFDAGGDSLRLTSVVATLRERLGLQVTRLDMFGHPTVRAMAAHVADAGRPAEPAASRPRRSRDTAALARRRDRRGRRP